MADRRDFASDIRTNIACRNLSISPVNLEYVDYVAHDHVLPIVPDSSSFMDNNFIKLLFEETLTSDDEPRAAPKPLHARLL